MSNSNRRRIMYDVKNKPSKDRLGRTDIFERTWKNDSNDYVDVPMGFLSKKRGEDYNAIVIINGNETNIGGFDTRSKGAHAIRKSFEAAQEAIA